MRKFYQYILQLVLSPGKAWEDIDIDDPDANTLERRGMIPLMALAAATALVQTAYHSSLSLLDAAARGVGEFVSLFAGYFITVKLLAGLAGRCSKQPVDQERAKTVAVMGMSLMSLSALICNLMPVQLGLAYLLPIYAVVVTWRSASYLGIDRDMVLTYLVLVAVSVALPAPLMQSMFDYVIGS